LLSYAKKKIKNSILRSLKEKRAKMQMGREAFLPENCSNYCSIQTWKIQLWLLAIKFNSLQASVKYLTTIATRVIKAHSYTFNLPNLKPTSLKYQVSYQPTSSTFLIKLQNNGHKGTLSYFQFTEFRINYD